MAIFVNPHQHPLRFEIDQQWFGVDPNGGRCDIPDRKAFAVKNRGLPLVTLDEWLAMQPPPPPPPPPAPPPAPEPPPAPVEESPVPASPESPPAPQAKPRSARKPVDPPAVPDADKASPT